MIDPRKREIFHAFESGEVLFKPTKCDINNKIKNQLILKLLKKSIFIYLKKG